MFYWMTTVRGDAVRRARAINRSRAEAIPRHLLFDQVDKATDWMKRTAGEFWPCVSNDLGRQNGGPAVYIRAAHDGADSGLLFGIVQRVEKQD